MSQNAPQNDELSDLPRDKAEVLARIAASHATLQATLGQWTDAQLTGPTDAQGWTIKDHLTHLAAWERSMVSLLHGRPRHEGLGVPEAVYQRDEIDEINAAIRERHKDCSLAEARELFADTHRQMLTTLDARTYDDLLKPYSHYLPDEPGDDNGSPVLDKVMGNTAEHYAEHLPWMAAIVG
ncbi:MAG: hypothetical protein AVDCRST_MAG18-722 [uncultured Thermomicrobiales bacterium]|uniref:ClbS/DfsB family four-helix bundle protein n=1 Tax=uncultured Thermomicrobiales bacterium TaxID=1645740 RepID=A0A6J4UU51_9BACT|nr:MAG: hypothetical protein AVDCRST_MAG18-722 [uncultured Thermomicrobiales bacterium]